MRITPLLRLFIISAASRKATSGKEISDIVNSITLEEWKPGPGMLYPLLNKMEKERLLEASLGKGERRREVIYSSTKKGKKYLEEYGKKMMFESEMDAHIPLMLYFIHEMTEEEIKTVMKDIKRMNGWRKKILELPPKKRKEMLLKAMNAFKGFMGETK